MFNRFMNWLVPKLEQWCLRNDRLILISGTDDPENVYLRRMVLFRSKLFSIYIHRFMRSDKDDHHDHPFDFLGYIVKHGYKESLLVGGELHGPYFILDANFRLGERRQGTWAYRKAEDIHMVFTPNERKYEPHEYKEAPLTIIFRGPYRRQWGFWSWSQDGAMYWTDYRKYLGIPEEKEGARE